MKIKPKLIDYNFIELPKKAVSEIQKKIVTTDNSKLYLNLFMILVLVTGVYILYNRMITKEETNNENRANILFLNEYINYSLGNSKIVTSENNEKINLKN